MRWPILVWTSHRASRYVTPGVLAALAVSSGHVDEIYFAGTDHVIRLMTLAPGSVPVPVGYSSPPIVAGRLGAVDVRHVVPAVGVAGKDASFGYIFRMVMNPTRNGILFATR